MQWLYLSSELLNPVFVLPVRREYLVYDDDPAIQFYTVFNVSLYNTSVKDNERTSFCTSESCEVKESDTRCTYISVNGAFLVALSNVMYKECLLLQHRFVFLSDEEKQGLLDHACALYVNART